MVISAHNDVFGEIFRYLEDLELEDRVTVYSGSQSFDYVVKAKRVVEPNDFKAYLQQRIAGKTNAQALQAINQSPYAVTTEPFDTRRGEQAPEARN